MQIIISWQMIVFIFAFYFITKYLYDSAKKLMAGCQNPFNPLYSYRDYPIWAKGYHRGRNDLFKSVKKIMADFQAGNKEILKEYYRSKESADVDAKGQ